MTLAGELESHLPAGTSLVFGQLCLNRCDDGTFEACHLDDMGNKDTLMSVDSVIDLREIAKFDACAEYRPLKTAPTLKGGWLTRCADAAEFLKRLDAIYPAVFATWIAYAKGEHDPTSLRRTLDRQTGMYRFAGTISDQMANRMMRELCHPGCIRTIAWPINDEHPVSRLKSQPRSIPVICTEACTFAINAARSLAKEAFDKANAPAAEAGG
jgi:sirohydrochlorin cobaltochelatase